MTNLSGVVQQLKKARARAEGEVKRLGAALAALGNLTGRSLAKKRRTLSAAARRKISLAQKARWAKWASSTRKGVPRTSPFGANDCQPRRSNGGNGEIRWPERCRFWVRTTLEQLRRGLLRNKIAVVEQCQYP